MFTISIDFLEQLPPKAPYSMMSIDEIWEFLPWEADLTVVHNDQILFSERIAVVEFYWYLINWYRRFLTGSADRFAYSSVEHTKPILVFSPQQNQYWKIDSVWKRCDKTVLIEEEMLRSEVHKLLSRMIIAIED